MSTLLEVEKLDVTFTIRQTMFSGSQPLHANSDISFDVVEGEVLGIVGESGCGKSTLGRAILRLIEPTGGKVKWRGQVMGDLSSGDMRSLRREMQIIFQDPLASLDPRMTVGKILLEPLEVFAPELDRKGKEARVLETMAAVGLSPEMVNRYPHEFSGGQAQRIGIARALVTKPKLIICDEPVSALDVSIQAQIIQLLDSLRRELGLTLIFISHDLSVVRLLSDRIMVLYLGRMVELGDAKTLFDDPQHPYTQALLAAAPKLNPKEARMRVHAGLKGDPPSPLNPPSGCAFRSRCTKASDICAKDRPKLRSLENGSSTACHHISVKILED
jgi:oligopeptide transport system ATP-binding protein